MIHSGMRDKVLRAFDIYAEGGSIAVALDGVGLKRGRFYEYLRKNPAEYQKYLEIQRSKADMIVDEAYQISMNEGADPKLARVQAEIRLKIAAAYDRKRFGDKMVLEHDTGPNLQEALDAAKRRALLPPRDLGQLAIVQDAEIIEHSSADATDEQSDVPPNEVKPGDVDIFED